MIACRRLRASLHRDAAALSDAERLVLEEHLQGCADCRRDRAQLLRLRELGGALPIRSIGSRGHQRAISRALLEGPPVPAAPARPSGWYALAGCAAIATAAVAIAVHFAGDTGYIPPAPPIAIERPSEPRPAPPPAASIEAGAVSRDGAVLAIGAAVPADASLHAAKDARILLPAASLTAVADSELRWSAPDHTVYLDSGTLDVEVDPKQRARARVVTARFVIEVTGTIFRASTRGVAVARGSVRVTSRDGAVLAARVAAGESWEVAELRVGAPPPSAASWLARARTAFAARSFADAERHADAALDASPSRAQAAEARVVLAECAQASGRLDDAVARYRAIAARFADLPAAESALFAAARIEASRGRTALLRQYLDRYPAGRFVVDARRQLGDER